MTDPRGGPHAHMNIPPAQLPVSSFSELRSSFSSLFLFSPRSRRLWEVRPPWRAARKAGSGEARRGRPTAGRRGAAPLRAARRGRGGATQWRFPGESRCPSPRRSRPRAEGSSFFLFSFFRLFFFIFGCKIFLLNFFPNFF